LVVVFLIAYCVLYYVMVNLSLSVGYSTGNYYY